MSRLTNKFWDNVAFIYTAFMKKNDVCFDGICAEIRPHLSKEMEVLELACGTGQMTYRLASGVKSIRATDFSSKMLARAAQNGAAENVSFCEADATKLQFEDASFDGVIISNALHIMPEPDAALREIHRVLRPGGFLAAPTFVYDPGYRKVKIWLMERLGFHPYHKWTSETLAQYVSERRFEVISKSCIESDPSFECVLCAKKK